MIVPMNKVTVLCMERDREATLERLRALGILHLHPVRPPENAGVDRARRDLEYVQRALDTLPHRPHVPPSGRTPVQVVRALWDLIHARKALDEEAEALRHEEQRIEPFGSFDPAAARELEARGIRVRLFRSDPGREPAAPADHVLQVLGRTKSAVHFAVLGRGLPKVEGLEVRMPAQGLDAVRSRLAEIAAERERLERELERYGGDYPTVARMRAEAGDYLRFEEARAGMGGGQAVAYLVGFCPAAETGRLRDAAGEGGWGLLLEEPGGDDPVPTLVRSPRWVRPIQAVFRMIGILPGYREIDISVFFLLFFSLFFAMLVGDAGYGAIFLGLTFWGRRKWPAASREPFALLHDHEPLHHRVGRADRHVLRDRVTARAAQGVKGGVAHRGPGGEQRHAAVLPDRGGAAHHRPRVERAADAALACGRSPNSGGSA